jgi:amino acid permease
MTLGLSSLGLPESFKQEFNNIPVHHRFQEIWVQCVFHVVLESHPNASFAATAASFMNTVILSSVVSAGNHALFAGTRVLYGLAKASQAPSVFARTTRGGVPLPALFMTSSISALCFASSFIGSGQLWAWLQNLVGVSNQVRRPCLLHAIHVC